MDEIVYIVKNGDQQMTIQMVITVKAEESLSRVESTLNRSKVKPNWGLGKSALSNWLRDLSTEFGTD